MINGVTLSVVFVVYELSSIVSVFIISALVFGILGFIGYKTNRDLNSWGTYIIVFFNCWHCFKFTKFNCI